jgi:chaperonin GroES
VRSRLYRDWSTSFFVPIYRDYGEREADKSDEHFAIEADLSLLSESEQAETRVWKECNMKLRPLDDRVVVKPLEAEEKTPGGIVLPDTAKEKPQMGRVQAVGPGKLLDDGKRGPMAVRKNDQVIYGKYSGSEVEIDGKTYNVLRESEILGIVEK